ncbi:MAG: hypothetical protein ACK5MD_10290 [Flavobacteriales bacterium]
MIGNLKDYFNNRMSLLKLEVIEGVGKGLARNISVVILAVLFFFMYFFLMFGISWYIGKYFLKGDIPLGFVLTGFVHLVLFVIALIFRKNLIEKHVLNFFIHAAFNIKDEEDED